jgi:hypothetical protein
MDDYALTTTQRYLHLVDKMMEWRRHWRRMRCSSRFCTHTGGHSNHPAAISELVADLSSRRRPRELAQSAFIFSYKWHPLQLAVVVCHSWQGGTDNRWPVSSLKTSHRSP